MPEWVRVQGKTLKVKGEFHEICSKKYMGMPKG
jgi:hypothetical protein